jgi:RNA polymerase sigma-70 factor, ECF subfamily
MTEIEVIFMDSGRKPQDQFKSIYDLLIDKVFAYVSFRVRDKETATDLVQEIFIDLYNALEKFTYQSDAQFFGFVFTITKRKLAKHYQKHLAEPEVMNNSDLDLQNQPQDNFEEKDLVNRGISSLSDLDQEIIIMHHWSRYTFPEIASLLNMTDAAVRVRHHRALNNLSTILTNQN